MADFEILEHTADVGLRARGDSLEEVFEQATRALAEITGTWTDRGTEECDIVVDGYDNGSLLVNWLSEVLYVQDGRDVLIAGVDVETVGAGAARGKLSIAPRGPEEPEGTQVKAITYHQLRVQPTPSGWVADVYVDV